jgi:pimeloyl-ACP methyl ester carboxylesterase
MHLALLHDGRPALLRLEGPAAGPVALFFHPFPLHGDAWDEVLAACASAGIRAAALDAPGFGGTPPLGRALAMDALADLGAAALDALGAARAAVVGCSMGGYAAMAFARKHGPRMAAAVLISTKASADSDEARLNRERQARIALEKGPQAAVAEVAPKLLAADATTRVRQRVEELAARATAQGIADALRGMAARPDSTHDLPGWKVPALVIAGEKDQLMPRGDQEAIAQGIPGARFQIVPGAGHLPVLENPGATIPLVVNHLKANAGR